ncbi:MAG: L,D-transpeptidase family protein [Hyphomicrobiaceae bacterium]
MESPPRRRLVPLILPAIVAATVAAPALLLLWPSASPNEDVAIEAERTRRWLVAATGRPLPSTPPVDEFSSRLAAHGLQLGTPLFVRIFKREFELELWMLRDGRFHRFATYPICRWSGRLGPKLHEGDRQAPEGFYSVGRSALNPASRWHKSFDLGFPNAFDASHGRSGTFLMVHGGCSSVGCYAMTNPVIDELWRVIAAAFRGGQIRFHVHVFPFRMTSEALARRAHHPAVAFWRDLKAGYDAFEETFMPPKVFVCRGRYVVVRQQAVDNEPVRVRCQTS